MRGSALLLTRSRPGILLGSADFETRRRSTAEFVRACSEELEANGFNELLLNYANTLLQVRPAGWIRHAHAGRLLMAAMGGVCTVAPGVSSNTKRTPQTSGAPRTPRSP